MYVDYVRKFVFFHNPKTGGRSTIKALGLPEDKELRLVHFGPSEARRCIFQQGWDDFFTFCFVRNPWDRMVSLYEYHRSVDYGIFQRRNTSHLLALEYSFEDWLKINKSGVKRSHWFGKPQSFWMNGVSKVYRFEEYDLAFAEISRRLGYETDIFHINRSRRKSYREYYKDEESIDTVAKIDGFVISAFNYEF